MTPVRARPRRYAGGGRAGGQLPTGPPSRRQVTTTDGLAKSPSGQVEAGFSTLAPVISPGCCTATNTERSSPVMNGPQVSAPGGTVRNCLRCPRSAPSIAVANSPSLLPRALPSVAIQRLPALSKATLSGHEIGDTADLS